jgi:hypothetical protein
MRLDFITLASGVTVGVNTTDINTHGCKYHILFGADNEENLVQYGFYSMSHAGVV